MKVNRVVFQFKKEEYENKCREVCFMDPGCNNKDGNKISVITNLNSKPEYCSVGLYIWVKEDCNC